MAQPQVEVEGLRQFIRDAKTLGKEFEAALRVGSQNVAAYVVNRSQQSASTTQERQVSRGLRAKKDKVPTIDVASLAFNSTSRPNSRRKTKAKVLDLFYGVEFGGGKHGAGNRTNRVTRQGKHVRKGGGYTTQFRPHLGTTGYFFYPTVRKEGPAINKMYARAVDDALKHLED